MVRRPKLTPPPDVPTLLDVSGSVPGILDPTQPSRLLRYSNSTLSFASFDPDIAAPIGISRLGSLSLSDEQCPPKRIVIETIPGKGTFWRWIPRARKVEHVMDEGTFPRVVLLCGQAVVISQEQWDIYKLDPLYDCFVDDFSRPSVISKKASPMFERFKSPSLRSQGSASSIVPDDEDIDMMDEDGNSSKRRSRPKSTPRERFDFTNFASTSYERLNHKRTEENAYFKEDSQNRNTKHYTPKVQKRARTLSPSSSKRASTSHRTKRKSTQQARWEVEKEARKQERERKFMREVLSEVPQPQSHSEAHTGMGESNFPDIPQSSEETGGLHAQKLEESRRKMAELNADRDRQRQREQLYRGEEEEARRVKAEARRQAEEKMRQMEAEARRLQEQEETRLRDQERRRRVEMMEHLDRERALRHLQWERGVWTNARAIERFKAVLEFFVNTRFEAENFPLTFIDIPWPTLRRPNELRVQDVDWQGATAFFDAAKSLMSVGDYKKFVKICFLKLHTDRWSSRRLYAAIMDEGERNEIETGQCLDSAFASLSIHYYFIFSSCEGGDPESTSDQQAGNGHQVSNNFALHSGIHQPPSSAPLAQTAASWPVSGPSLGSDNPSTARGRPPPQPPQAMTPHNHQQANRAGSIPRNLPLYVRLMMYFGVGRRASHARKSLVSLIWNVSWGFLQVVAIITMLILTGTLFRSTTNPSLSEWTACDRPLGVWASLWVVRVVLASVLAYWEFQRDRVLHPARADSEANSANFQPHAMVNENGNPAVVAHGNFPANNPTNNGVPTPATLPEAPVLPHSRVYSRLTLLSSLMTLSWFLTAHILEYTSINTCRHTSPHLWWLVFGILCIMYLMVLEVVLLGLVVLVIAPILFIFWNIFLICIGRHPLQNPHMIKPEIGKLPKSIVDRIPLVMYIPPPPEGESDLAVQTQHSYPPKVDSLTPKPPHKRFKLLHNFSSFRSKKTDEGADNSSEKREERLHSDAEGPISWEDNWEQSEFPFVALEGNRAACAICLMDFEEPKRKNAGPAPEEPREEEKPEPISHSVKASSSSAPPPTNITEEQRLDQLKLADAGEGAQPLRLLACGHVFHKTCLDPWLTDVSGRCPVCQRAVEVQKSKKKSRRAD
ncbi:hypothetical protein GALMADRAFT_68821 [Galerina marginata CBS 339.88]|uniref:RING-type domain-containing protein n=1 Tax=Galerina marginata (strain CBS 339.88) TaxID=685588 RepID=A0A067T0Q9_GALM3|nr:hypothetical protein GALMADRAFT_68821 [Galerina marginata CBS 339.88]